MRKKIAITGIGGGVGQSIIKSLQGTEYECIGLDGDNHATGAFVVPKAYRIPYAVADDFIPCVLDICKRESCSLLFPGLDAELAKLAANKSLFQQNGIKLIVSDPAVIEVSDDKMRTFQYLTGIGINVPETALLSEVKTGDSILTYPVIIKQRIGGARSKNVFILRNSSEYDEFVLRNSFRLDEFIIQEYIDGPEYTCGTVCLDEDFKGAIIMQRVLRDGDTYKCFVEFNPVIFETVRKIVEQLVPTGACNIQLRLKNGVPYIFEINARCSGTTASRTLCGFNEPKMIADYFINGIAPQYAIKQLSILRYWKELVIENDKVEEFSSTGRIENQNNTLVL